MIALAEERGIAPSILLGRPWEPGEPLWTDDDLDQVLAYRRERARVCPGCGAHDGDWVDEAGHPINPPPLVPEMVRCPGCEQIEQARATVPDGERGVHVRLVPIPVAGEG